MCSSDMVLVICSHCIRLWFYLIWVVCFSGLMGLNPNVKVLAFTEERDSVIAMFSSLSQISAVSVFLCSCGYAWLVG